MSFLREADAAYVQKLFKRYYIEKPRKSMFRAGCRRENSDTSPLEKK